MNYNRILSGRIKQLADKFPVLVLTGARQTGKTTLLRNVFPGYRYISLDLPSLAEMAENDPLSFLTQYPAPLIIDEIQYAPGVFRHLKIQIDKNRELRGQFILTGSQNFILMKNVSDSLAGRCAILDLETLSYQEIKPSEEQNPMTSATRILHRGLFPELWKDPSIPSDDFYRSYLATYMERDVRQLINVTSLRDFERFIRLCATHNAQMINKADLAASLGIRQNTVNQWLSVLQASNQIMLLEPFFENIGKRIVKTPKLYFNDTGLLCFLLNLSDEDLLKSTYTGFVWETFIYSEIRKHIRNNGIKKDIYFYRDQQGHEVDFILWSLANYHLVETKWTENPDSVDMKNLDILEKIINVKKPEAVVRKILVSRTANMYTTSNNIAVVNGFDIVSKI